MISGRAKYTVKISPTKLNRIAVHVRGKSVDEALQVLSALRTPSAEPVKKLLLNAKNNLTVQVKNHKKQDDKDVAIDWANLIICEFTVNKGRTLKRYRFASRGNVDKNYRRQSKLYIKLEYYEKDGS